LSEDSSWIFRFAPYVIFVTPILVALLIPVLTTYPLFFAFMGDMLGGALEHAERLTRARLPLPHGAGRQV
jgi:formate hydrogenlyase subunit 4